MARRHTSSLEHYTSLTLLGLFLTSCFVIPLIIFLKDILLNSPPFLLGLTSFVCFLSYVTTKKYLNHTLNDFWLNEHQKQYLLKACAEWDAATQKISDAVEAAEAKNLKQNIDGSYHRGSRTGQFANDTIYLQTPIVNSQLKIIDYYRYKPQKDWSNFHKVRNLYYSTLVGTIVWIVVYICCYWWFGYDELIDTKNYILFGDHSGIKGPALFLSGLVSCISTGLCWLAIPYYFKPETPEPPMVTEHNLNLFSRHWV